MAEPKTPGVYFDDQERQETAEALKALPPDHAVHAAFRMGVGPLELTHIAGSEHPELVNRLKRIYLDAHGRMLRRHREGSKPK